MPKKHKRKLPQVSSGSEISGTSVSLKESSEEFAQESDLFGAESKTNLNDDEIENRVFGSLSLNREDEQITKGHHFFGVRIHQEGAQYGNKSGPRRFHARQTSHVHHHRHGHHLKDDEEDDWEEEIQIENQYDTPTEVVFKKGKVVKLLVDPTFLHDIKKSKSTNLSCCIDREYTVGPELEDLETRNKFISKVLFLENMMHLVTLVACVLQYKIHFLQDFFYEQFALTGIAFGVTTVTLVWAIIIDDLGRYPPADDVILAIKTLAQSISAIFITVIAERIMVIWQTVDLDLPNFDSISYIDEKVIGAFTFPFIAPIFFINITLTYAIVVVRVRWAGGDIYKDGVFFLVLMAQVSFSSLQLFLITWLGHKHKDTFPGPTHWDWFQVIFTGLVSAAWGMMRMYNLRCALQGRRYHITAKEYKLVVLDFNY